MSENSKLELPEPKGYRILIAIPKKEETFKDSQIVIAESVRQRGRQQLEVVPFFL